jgi:arylsulfatase A-like enzyme
MRRRDFLKTVGLGTLGLWAGCATAGNGAPRRRPNIVLILIDDLGYADLGCYGSTLNETPRLDALAAEGVRFTDGYAACPVCSPTRASIMTGKYPARLKLTNFLKGELSPDDSPVLTAPYKDRLELEEVTVAERLGSAGYATAHVGKWHLGPKPYWPENQGFDVNVGGSASGMPRSHFWPRWKDNPPLAGRADGEYLTDRLTDEACAFIEAHADRPFYLNLCHYSVHLPLEAKEALVAKYEAKLKSRPPKPGEQNNAVYAAMMESVDAGVGKVLDTLERCGIADDTLVVFTSDNGGLSVEEGPRTPATVNHPLRAGKGYLYEGGVRVPLIVRWPGVAKAGAACAAQACSVDFLPTFCAAAGVDGPLPAQVDGIDLGPVLREPTLDLGREALYWHYPHFSNQGGRPGGAVRAGDWKLIERYETGELELYNLRDDVGESRNVAAEQPQTAQRLQGMLTAWRADVGATMPPRNPRYRV